MNERYSFFALARHAVNGRKPWSRVLHRPTLQPAYDAVIIGGGHNGLVCAAYLGMAGLKVVVLERRPVVGGAAGAA